MAKIVYRPLKSTGKASVATKRVKGPGGKAVTVHVVNSDSKTFEDDLSYVFRHNVRKARRKNRQLATARPAPAGA
jgi:hypothetical protein